MSSIILSYSLTLSQSIYPQLNYLISINKRKIKSWLKDLWNNETLNKLKRSGKALTILKQNTKREEKWIPPRVLRLLEINPTNTSRYCHKCEKKEKTDLLFVIPLTKLKAYSCLVETSVIPVKKLIKYIIDLNDYGYR